VYGVDAYTIWSTMGVTNRLTRGLTGNR
jgi:hypothetical protein